MTENAYKFDLPKHHRSIIKVIGVGGGGSNAVNHMFNQGIKDVEFVVCNTDSQALQSSPVPSKLQIGIHLTEGLGAGANPEVGRSAALESKEEIRELLSENTRMVFITAGMGGGTGTGAAPVIAQIANELDILTVGIVTAPFLFEGRKKTKAADEGITALKEHCDTVLVIMNDKLREVYGNLPIREAFGQADNVLTTASKGIAEIITVPGYINVDFEDVKTVMKGSGAAVMGSAQTSGENRAIRAAEEAISSPLLNNKNIHGAQKILLSIISGENAELQMDELSQITEYIQEEAGDEAEVIFGHGVDEVLGESIRVTLIATGFELDTPLDEVPAPVKTKKVFDLESSKQVPMFSPRKDDDTFEKVREEKKKEKPLPTERTYTFEMREESKPKEEPEPEDEKIFFEIGDDFEIIDRKDLEQDDYALEELEGMAQPISRKSILKQESKERREKLDGLKKNGPQVESENFKDMLEVPAYLRKKVKLQDVPHSSERNVSRFKLNDDNQILGNNRFLHDNVD